MGVKVVEGKFLIYIYRSVSRETFDVGVVGFEVRDLLVAHFGLSVVAETGQLSTAVIFVVHVVGHILQVLQMCPDNHISECNEITVI